MRATYTATVEVTAEMPVGISYSSSDFADDIRASIFRTIAQETLLDVIVVMTVTPVDPLVAD